MRKFKYHFILAAGAGLLWILQFFLIPALMPQFFPLSNEASLCLVLPPLIISISGSWFFETRLTQWLPADLIYALLIALKNQNGLYGIGLRGVLLDGTSPSYSSTLALIIGGAIMLGLILTQATTYGMKALSRK